MYRNLQVIIMYMNNYNIILSSKRIRLYKKLKKLNEKKIVLHYISILKIQ